VVKYDMRWGLAAAAAIVITTSTVAADEPRPPPDIATALTDPEKLPQRVHVARRGMFGLTADTTLGDESPSGLSYDDVPLLETQPGRVRVVHDEDSARMFLWINEKDLGWAIAKKTRIAGKGDVGVWLLPGARVTATGKGAKRKIKTKFNSGLEVSLSGVVPADALTRIFTEAPAPTDTGAGASFHAPAIRLEPRGRRMAGMPDGLSVHKVAPGSAGWQLVEHRGRWLEVRGWVHDRDLGGALRMSGTGGGLGLGMSHTDRVDVPAGTCFYAAAGGPIVGVALETELRYTPDHDATWWTIYVASGWGKLTVKARATSTDAAGKPTFATCTP